MDFVENELLVAGFIFICTLFVCFIYLPLGIAFVAVLVFINGGTVINNQTYLKQQIEELKSDLKAGNRHRGE